MKARRHHNNKGFRQIKRGRTRQWAERMERQLMEQVILKQTKPRDPNCAFVRVWETVSDKDGHVKGRIRNWVIPSNCVAALALMLDTIEARKEKP